MSFDPQAATIRTLNTQTLRRLSPLLDQALDLPEAERIPWLRGLDAEHADLVPILEGMLNPQAASQVDQMLQGIEQFQTQAFHQQPHQPGEIIGPYRLKQRVGEGGMGEVWLADRTDGSLKRDVALKLPTIYDQSRILLERFARERDILAALNHPHIASIYDAGISNEGQPYLALEYVGGAQSITAYARTAMLDARARVALIQQVCTAVQYAHANLVIHRDIKPGNVLVTPEGKAVLLDFGIAKLLEDHAQHAEESDLTRHGGRSLTISYAAPEQITGGAISTATDTWALGVLLYELLAGERPFQGANPSEIDQAVRTQEPKPPSQCSQGVINLLGKGLARELDTIVLKALKKLPEERYSTVIALSDDLQRWLDGQPVLAQPDSLWYRSRKFVTRHSWGVAWGSTAIVLLMVISGVAAYQAHLARAESARAVAARDFMIDLFAQADTNLTHGKQRTAVEIMDLGRSRIMETLKDQPLLQADLLYGLAVAQLERNELIKADSTMGEAVKLYEATGQPEKAADALINQARVLFEIPDLSRARVMLARASNLLGSGGQDAVWARYYELMARMEVGDTNFARAHAERALALLGSSKGENHALMVDVLTTLAGEENFAKDYAAALTHLEQAQAIAAQSSRLAPDRVLDIQSNLSQVDFEAGHYAAAAQRLKVALSRCEQSIDPFAATCSNLRRQLADALNRQGHHSEAVALLPGLQPLSVNGEAPGNAPVMQITMGRILARTKTPDEHLAVWSKLQALADSTDDLEVFSGRKVNALHVLAVMRLQRGEPHLALQLLETAQQRFGSTIEASPRLRIRISLLRGLVLHALGQPEPALQALRDSTAFVTKFKGADHPDTLLASVNQVRTLWVLGRTPEAIALLDHALPVLSPALGSDSPSYVRIVKLRELITQSPVPDSRAAKVVDLFL